MLTDENGRTSGGVVSATEGNSAIQAIDVTGNVALAAPASLRFDPDPLTDELRAAINLLDRTSRQQLDVVAQAATEAGAGGDYFAAALTEDAIELGLRVVTGFLNFSSGVSDSIAASQRATYIAYPGITDAGWGGVLRLKESFPRAGQIFNERVSTAIRSDAWSGVTLTVLQGGLKYYAAALRDEAVEELGDEALDQLLNLIVSSPTGMSDRGTQAADDAAALQQYLASERARLLSDVPALTPDEQQRYANDLQKRTTVPVVLASTLRHTTMMLDSVRGARQGTSSSGVTMFLLKFAAVLPPLCCTTALGGWRSTAWWMASSRTWRFASLTRRSERS